MKQYYILFSSVMALVLPSYPRADFDTLLTDTLALWITKGTNFDFLLIDVRETSEAASVIGTNACRPYLLPWDSGVFVQTMNKLPKVTAIILYCEYGVRSGQAAQLLVDSGFTLVYYLKKGFNNWKGSTQSSSFIKPTDQLPEPSMHKKTTGIHRDLASQKREFRLRGKYWWYSF